nr:ABC transporter permease [uncultured Albidiferax sp.]
MFKSIPIIFIFFSQMALAQSGESACGPLQNGYGPYDYRTDKGSTLSLVEGAHFTPSVEMLLKANAGYIGGDLDYTLRAFPNHHRALMSVVRYGEKTKSITPPHMRYSIPCYFDRAIRFRPDDAIVRMLFSIYLAKNGRTPEAIQQLDTAAEDADGKENAFTHFNLGLNYFDLKEYNKSEIQAHKAYALGFPQEVLKEKLKGVGKWTEPVAQLPNSAASAPTPSN